MSSPIPYIRLKGDKDEAGRHLRRAMGELFKTEKVAQNAGVPILKRTIDVDDYTTITVQVSNDQRFVWIESNPPSGGVEQEVTEKEYPETSQCPPGFIIRKLKFNERWPTDSLNQEEYKGDGSFDGFPGYIIAYDGKEWRYARYDEAGLGAFEGASNCGWWHLNTISDKLNDKYRKCDLITWDGGPGGMTQTGQTRSTSSSSGPGGAMHQMTSPKLNFDRYFYHGGKKIDAGLDCVLGACIIPKSGVDYYHVIGFSATVRYDSNGNPFGYGVTGWKYYVQKRPVSGTTGWTQVGSIDAFEDNDGPIRPDYETLKASSTAYCRLPWGSGFVDADGYAYVTMHYYAEIDIDPSTPGVLQDHSYRLVKVDLRNAQWENVGDRSKYVTTTQSSGFSDGGGPRTFNAPPSQPEGKPYSSSSYYSVLREMSEPCFVGMFGGLDKLYTYWVEPFTEGVTGSTNLSDSLGPIYEWPHWTEALGDHTHPHYQRPHHISWRQNESTRVVMRCYEMVNGNVRGKINSELVMEDKAYDGVYEHEYIHAQHTPYREITSGGWEGYGQGHVIARHVWDHHPQIPNSWVYAEAKLEYDTTAEQGTKTFSVVRNGKTEVSDSFTGGVCPLLYDNSLDFPVQMVPQLRAGGIPYSSLAAKGRGIMSIDMWFENYVVLNDDVSELAGDRTSYEFLVQGDDGLHGWWIANSWQGQYTSYGWGIGHDHDFRTNTYDNFPFYEGGGGISGKFYIAQPSINITSDKKSLYHPTTRAVHRPIDGMDERPYMHLQRKIYAGEPMTAFVGSAPSFQGPSYGYYSVTSNFYRVYESYFDDGPLSENSYVTSAHYDNGYFGYLTFRGWRWWCKAPGNARDGYNAMEDWELKCNFLSAEQINKLWGYDEETDKGTANMFFEIALL